MTKKLEGRVLSARRRRRGSLKPALTGLTVFSLTCLLLGSVVYAAAVPGLIMSSDTIAAVIQAPANPAVGSQRLITSVLGGLIGAGGSSQEEADTKEDSSGGGAASSSSGVVSSVGGLSSLSSVVSGTLQGSVGLDASGKDGNKDSGDADAESGSSSGNADSNKGQNDAEGDAKPDPEPNPNPDKPGSDGSKPEDPEPEPEPTPEPDGPTPEEEEAYHQLLIEKYNGLSGYISSANECTAAFSGSSPVFLNPSREERLAASAQCDALSMLLFNEWGVLLNTPEPAGSQWGSARGDVLACYRSLGQYIECLSDVLTLSLQYDDPAAHQSEYSAPLEAAQSKLNEFNQVYSEVRL